MRRVLATDFGIWPSLKVDARVSDAMLTSRQQWAALANYLLLYDQVVIPTGNLQILPVLRLMLGEEIFDELIETKSIVLARYDHWMGYAGGGSGLVFYSIEKDPGAVGLTSNMATSFYQPLDEAIDVALASTNPASDPSRRSFLRELLLRNVVSLSLTDIAPNLETETYEDIQRSPYLRELMGLVGSSSSLRTIGGVGPNQVKIYCPHSPVIKDIPRLNAILRVAFENFVLGIGGTTKSSDITGDENSLTILRAKGQRFGSPIAGEGAFTQIQQISGVPDIGQAFAHKQLNPGELLRLRASKSGVALREWFSIGQLHETSEEAVHRFVDSLNRPSWIDSLPGKSIRLAITTAWGSWDPVSGTAASIVDGFFLSDLFPGGSPRLFMKEAKTILVKEPVVQAPSKRKVGRNSLCPCGKGKKYKKCCGR